MSFNGRAVAAPPAAEPTAAAAVVEPAAPVAVAAAHAYARRCLFTSFLAALVFCIVFPAAAHAAIYGDDYVGSLTVSERGLNVKQTPAIDAKRGILVDSQGTVLWSRQADEQAPMASITKIMTAIVALENASLDAEFEISEAAADVGESSAGLEEGQTFSLQTLLNGLLVHSGNDAAIAIAEGVGGSVDAFVEMMNAKASEMGLTNTHFANPSGLDADGHYSSAADISVMARYAMTNETFRSIVAQTETTIDCGDSKETLQTSNALLANWDACIGVKTGYTSGAGQCLASAAVQDGVELYAVVLGCDDEVQRFEDSYKLLNWGFDHYRSYTLATSEDILVDASMSGYLNRTVETGVASEVSAFVLDYNGDISIDVSLTDISDDVSEGDEVGSIVWRQGETIVASAPLVSKETIGAPMPWTSVVTAAARMVGLLTGDDAMAQSVVRSQTLPVEVNTDTSGQIVDSELDEDIRSYVSSYHS